jgi:hypothetical protein
LSSAALIKLMGFSFFVFSGDPIPIVGNRSHLLSVFFLSAVVCRALFLALVFDAFCFDALSTASTDFNSLNVSLPSRSIS